MFRSNLSVALVVFVIGCGGSTSGGVDSAGGGSGTDGGGSGGQDGGGGGDSGGGNIPATIMIAGTTSSVGLGGATPKSGITVAAFKASDDSMVATGTSDGSGNFTLTITTNGVALDGYLKATNASFLTTYLYPPKPLTADFSGATVELLTKSLLDIAAGQANTNQTSGDGFIGVEVLDGAGAKVGGAVITASSGTVAYDAGGPLPSKTATSTGVDGTGYIFSVTPGTVTMGATKSGATFSSHPVKAYANSVTETIVEP